MNEKQVAFRIKRIKEFSFLVNESLFELNREVKIQFQHSTKYYPDKNLVDLTLRVYYSYDSKIPPDSLLVDFHVQYVYEVQNLGQFKKESGQIILPEALIISILSISISHVRALMSQNIAGTSYQENIIPIVNPVDVAKAFYPEVFIDAKKANIEDKVQTEKGFKMDKIKKTKPK